jgi:scyllo-inositol 2-dehydrogenase (NADP+)
MTSTKPVCIGLLGIGRAGWGMHCEELASRQDTFRFVAACDLLPERRTLMAERYGCRTYGNIADLLADPDVELVDIASRSVDHFAHAAAALAAGKHVFLEKPMCVTYAEAVKLQELAGASEGKLFIRHNRRFEPLFMHVREILSSGILGDIFEIKLRRGGFQRRDDWQTILQFGGGQLLNWGPHVIDQGLRFLNSEPVRTWGALRKVAAAGDAEDYVKIMLEDASGLVVDLEISGGRTITEAECIVSGSRGGLSAAGSSIHLRYLDPAVELSRRRADPTTPEVTSFGSPDELVWIEKDIPVAPQQAGDTDSIWDHLYAALRNGEPFPVTLDEAVAVMKVISEARQGTPFDI